MVWWCMSGESICGGRWREYFVVPLATVKNRARETVMEEAASARLVETSGAGGTSGSREEERRGVEELGLFYCTRWAAGVRVLARPGGVM